MSLFEHDLTELSERFKISKNQKFKTNFRRVLDRKTKKKVRIFIKKFVLKVSDISKEKGTESGCFYSLDEAREFFVDFIFRSRISSQYALNFIDVIQSKSNPLIFYFVEEVDRFLTMDKSLPASGRFPRKLLLIQYLFILHHLHSADIIHRQLFPFNFPFIDSITDVKIQNFEKAILENGNYSPKQKSNVYEKNYNDYYKSPEEMFQRKYSKAHDMWQIGCLMCELIMEKPLFNEIKDELDHIKRIISITGIPSEEDWMEMGVVYGKENYVTKIKNYIMKNVHECKKINLENMFSNNDSVEKDEIDLISKLLTFNPQKRISVLDSLKHPFLKHVFNHSYLNDCTIDFKWLNKVNTIKFEEIKLFFQEIVKGKFENQKSKFEIIINAITVFNINRTNFCDCLIIAQSN